MSLQVLDAIAHIRHTLASDDVPSIGAHRILNDAGNFMVNMHHWQWCEGAESNLSLYKDQPYVWLPEDFREILAVQTTNGLNTGFRLTTHKRLLQLRSLAVANSFEYHAAISHVPRSVPAQATISFSSLSSGNNIEINDAYNATTTFQTKSSLGDLTDDTESLRFVLLGSTTTDAASNLAKAINDAPNLFLRATSSANVVTLVHQRPGARGNNMTITSVSSSAAILLDDFGVDSGPVRSRLELWPTPSQDELDRLMVYYRRGWQPIDSDTAFVSIPDWMEQLYIDIVRTVARAYERESESPLDVRLGTIKAGPVFAAAKLRDATMAESMGPIRGGAVHGVRSNYDHLWNFSSVANPS